mgnify:CR=1 FL=1
MVAVQFGSAIQTVDLDQETEPDNDTTECLDQPVVATPAAERVLLDVDALARCYGWTESEVLRLSPTRRAAYLQLAAA